MRFARAAGRTTARAFACAGDREPSLRFQRIPVFRFQQPPVMRIFENF
nr:MAG TPA: hypothetical protein [Caudoviricetes sp.]